MNRKLYPIKTKNTERTPSKIHQQAITTIKKRFPSIYIMEEVSVKIDVGKTLYLDIYLPSLGIIVEVNGRQHFKRINHFQSNESFLKQRMNDSLKREWAELNELRLVDFNYDESESEWLKKLG